MNDMSKRPNEERQIERREMGIQTRAAQIAPASIDAKARTIEVVWTTGARVRRFSWAREEEFDEELQVAAEAVRLDRLNGGAPFLDSHRSYGLGGVLGVVVEGSARISDGKGFARIRLSDRAEVEPIWRDIQSGIIRNVSVGYRVHKFDRIAKADRTDGGQRALYRAVDWEPMEISAVAIGADAGAQVRENESGMAPVIIERKGNTMDGDMKGGAAASAGATASDNPHAEAIRGLFKRHDRLDHAEQLIAQGASLDDARIALLDRLAVEDPAGRVSERASVGTSYDSPAGLRERIADARAAQVCERLGLQHEPTIGRELAGRDTVEQARWYADQLGVRGLGSDRRVLDWFARGGGGSHTQSDFPQVAAGTVQVVVGRAVEQSPIALLECVSRLPASDWRARKHVNFSSASPLRDVLEAGELGYVTIDESGEPLPAPVRKAAGFRVTDELLRNSASQGVTLDTQIARAMIETANESLRLVIGAAIKAPPDMADGTAVFDASRGNVGTDEDLDVAGLGAARAAMARFVDSQGTPRPVPTSKLLLPPELHTQGEKLIAEIAAATVNDVNPFSRRLQALSDPELPGDGFWYVLPDPAAYDGLALITLDDMMTPRIESRPGWETFGWEWRLQWPMAAAWLRPTWWRAPVPSDD